MNDPSSARTSDRLAEFLCEAAWEDLPANVKHEAKRSLMNFFACALGGCRDPAIESASRVLAKVSTGKTATVIGRAEHSDLLNGAFLNAASANVFDFDDTHEPTIIHPTAPVAPALFALAEQSRLTGQELLLAFVLGVETECRIGNAVRGHYSRGWHITSTCGVFGAAAAIGKILRLSSESMKWALGNASAQAGGLVETLGTMSKSISVGNAARNGLLSAMLAADGFSGPEQPLEGQRGFLRVTSDNPDYGRIRDGLGESWEILVNGYKPYPCGVVLNPVIEACLALFKEKQFSAADVERIELTGAPLLRERTDRANPSDGLETHVSGQHAVAVALTRGKAGLAEFSDACATDPALRAFGAKVGFIDDPSYPVESARVTVHLTSGKQISRTVERARGSSKQPLTDSDLEQKVRDLTEYGESGADPAPLIDAIWSLDRSDDAGSIMPLAAGVTR